MIIEISVIKKDGSDFICIEDEEIRVESPIRYICPYCKFVSISEVKDSFDVFFELKRGAQS